MFLNRVYDQEYWDRHPIQDILLLSLVFPVFTAGLAYFGFDPIKDGRILPLGILIALFLSAFYKLSKTKGISRVVMVIVIIVMISTCIYMYLLGRAQPLGTGAAFDEAVATLTKEQQTVSVCAKQRGDLLSATSYKTSATRYPPTPGYPICTTQTALWEVLPAGWEYDHIRDRNGSNGTLRFGAHNRNRDRIICTEQQCILRDRSGAKTTLSHSE